MLRLQRYVPAVLALACLASAASCVYYTALPDSGDGGPEAGVSSSSGTPSTSGATGSSSGYQVAPAFAPTFDSAGTPGVRVAASSCPTPTGNAALHDGTFTYQSGCMEDEKFVEQLPICNQAPDGGPRAHVLDSLAKIDGAVTISSGGTMASRAGSMFYAIDIVLPCRQSNFSGKCSNLTTILTAGLGSNATPNKVACYDISETECECQVEVKVDLAINGVVSGTALFDDKVPFWVDQLGGLTITRNFKQFSLYPEATGYWTLTP